MRFVCVRFVFLMSLTNAVLMPLEIKISTRQEPIYMQIIKIPDRMLQTQGYGPIASQSFNEFLCTFIEQLIVFMHKQQVVYA